MNKLIKNEDRLTVYHRLKMGKRSDLTRKAYTQDLRTFSEFVGNDVTTLPNDKEVWQQLDTAFIAAYIEYLKTTISEHTGRPYSTATIARKVTAIKELLTEASYQGLYPVDSLKYIKERLETPEVTSEHHSGMTPDEQEAILSMAASQPGLKGLRDYAIFRLWLETGIRRAELASLKVRDLKVREGVPNLTVRQGKGNKTRDIPLEGYTYHILQKWIAESGQSGDSPIFCQIRKFGRGDEADYKIVNPDKHLLPVAYNQLVQWYVKTCGIESKVTPHSFRVALVTDSLNGGAPIQHVQRVTGHTTTRMITEVYDRNQYNEPVSAYRKRALPRMDSE